MTPSALPLESSWLAGTRYERGRLELSTLRGDLLVFEGVPAWVPGLIHAHRSPGRAVRLLVIGKGYPYHREMAVEVDEQDLQAVLEASIAMVEESRR